METAGMSRKTFLVKVKQRESSCDLLDLGSRISTTSITASEVWTVTYKSKSALDSGRQEQDHYPTKTTPSSSQSKNIQPR
jgi:hypothetical protein